MDVNPRREADKLYKLAENLENRIKKIFFHDSTEEMIMKYMKQISTCNLEKTEQKHVIDLNK
jgi:hypothetical protein